jgi:hypothetical protein
VIVRADDIPVAHTPTGGYGDVMPAPVLADCSEPLAPGAPDLRGLWRVVAVDWHIDAPEPDHMADHVERIEQCGDRVCITAGGVVHDMRADGTRARGVHDVAAAGGRPIEVVCTFEDGVHALRPVGMPDVIVTRHLEGDQLVWRYGPLFTARLERIEP